jgi:hypothetical protein
MADGMKKQLVKAVIPVLFFVLLFSAGGCKKDNGTIPEVYVDFYLYLTQPEFAKLNAVGGWVYVTGGVKGIIIFKKSSNEFAAYERSCPYDPNAANARITVDNSNIIGVDNNCGSKFNLMDNSILSAPATRSMKTYYADYDVSLQRVHVHS